VILSIDPDRALPVYEQVREQMMAMIAAGTLPVGAQLPTIRQLAGDLGLAKGTIERTYELLEAAGAIETRGRHGTFVRAVPTVPKRARVRALDQEAAAFVLSAYQHGATQDEAVEAVQRAWRQATRRDQAS
jgi:GntR family transcriptional regulator